MSEHERLHSEHSAYHLSYEQADGIVAEFLSQHEEQLQGIQYLEVATNHPLADAGRAIEGKVFEKFFNNTPEDMIEEYGPYESRSNFFVAIDPEKQKAVGVMRTLHVDEPSQSLKIFDDLKKDEPEIARLVSDDRLRTIHGIESLENCWELGTIAIAPGYRNGDRKWYQKGIVSAQLIRTMYLSARSQGVEHMIAAMDTEPYHKMVKRYLGLPYIPLCDTEPFEYLGSPSTQLIYGHVPEFYDAMRRKMRTAQGALAHGALRLLVLGKGDVSIHLPPEHTPAEYQG